MLRSSNPSKIDDLNIGQCCVLLAGAAVVSVWGVTFLTSSFHGKATSSLLFSASKAAPVRAQWQTGTELRPLYVVNATTHAEGDITPTSPHDGLHLSTQARVGERSVATENDVLPQNAELVKLFRISDTYLHIMSIGLLFGTLCRHQSFALW